MNLIGHLACARRFGASVRLGSVLPDLLPLFRRRPRISTLTRMWEGEISPAPEMQALLRGIRFHHYVDVEFHHGALFRGCSGGLLAALKEASDTGGLKRFFPAHVLTELFFDRELMQHFPGLATDFNRLLEGEPLALATTFASRHPELGAGELHEFFSRLADAGFVEEFRSAAGIFRRMNQILGRYRQRSLEGAEQDAVTEFFRERADWVKAEVLRFVERMQQWEDAPPDAPRWERADRAVASRAGG